MDDENPKPMRDQIMMIDGKPTLVKASKMTQSTGSAFGSSSHNKRVVEVDQQNRKLSSLQYLRGSKALKAPRWTPEDEQKFYDALKVFGENCDLIHSVVFDPLTAKKRFKNESDFSERSIVQLKKKFKKDGHLIDELITNKDPSETVEWFEAKYSVDITKFNTQRVQKL